MQMPGRKLSGGYRYGFNGQEKSDDVFEGSTTALFWQYDLRLGKRWNIDPIPKTTLSGYVVLGNNPIIYVDPSGADWFKGKGGLYDWSDKSGGKRNFWSDADKNGIRTWYGNSKNETMMQGNDLKEVIITASKKTSNHKPSSELGLKMFYRDIYIQETMNGKSPFNSKYGDEYRSFVNKYQGNFNSALEGAKFYRTVSFLTAGMTLSGPSIMGALESGGAFYLYQASSWTVRNYGASFVEETGKELLANRGNIRGVDWHDVLTSTIASKFNFFGKAAVTVWNTTIDYNSEKGIKSVFLNGGHSKSGGEVFLDGVFSSFKMLPFGGSASQKLTYELAIDQYKATINDIIGTGNSDNKKK